MHASLRQCVCAGHNARELRSHRFFGQSRQRNIRCKGQRCCTGGRGVQRDSANRYDHSNGARSGTHHDITDHRANDHYYCANDYKYDYVADIDGG